MWTKRLSFLLLLFAFTATGAASYSQTVFLSGGALLSSAPAGSNLAGTRPAVQFGARLHYTDFFRLQAAVTNQNLISIEGALMAFPFGQEQDGLRPYAFAGFGRYVGGNTTEHSVIPVGVGVEYPLLSGVALNAELAGRWTYNEDVPNGDFAVYSGLMPSVGISYEISNLWDRPPRPAPQPAPIAERTAPENENEPEDEGDAPEGVTPTPDPATTEADGFPGAAEGGVPVQPPLGNEDAVAERAPVGGIGSVPFGAAGASATEIDTTDGAAVEGMMLLPDGTFIMGLTDADPLQLQNAGRMRVTISSFYIDRHEVTNQDYRAYVDALSGSAREAAQPDSIVWEQAGSRLSWNDYYRDAQFSNYPVVGVTYEQAQSFCAFHGKRLPTEAEWEYAARGGLVGGVYPWPGFEPRNQQGKYLANYNPGRGGYAADGYAFTAPVTAYPPNRWGLYNMSGNVAEWVADAYTPNYAELSDFNPLYEEDGEELRVVRGGSWASGPFYIGVGVRDAQPMEQASPQIGFRCAVGRSAVDEMPNRTSTPPSNQSNQQTGASGQR